MINKNNPNILSEYDKECNELKESYVKINKLKQFHFDSFHISRSLSFLKELVEILTKCVNEKRLMSKEEREIFYPIDLDMDEVDI
jgi:hypothetical protein|tara:strand:+ start:1202 stop:1456 length:255 start_codon:yes stop_codon:yes gene_type:complete